MRAGKWGGGGGGGGGGGSPVPVLVGSNSVEGAFFQHGPPGQYTAAALAAQLSSLVAGNATLAAAAAALYPAVGSGGYQVAMALSFGHAKVNCVARRVARAAAGTPGTAAAAAGAAFLYHFARADPCSPRFSVPTHTSELAYVFGQPTCGVGSVGGVGVGGAAAAWPLEADDELSEAMMAAWASFGATGAPGGAGLAWRPVSAGALLWNATGAAGTMVMQAGWLQEECELWDEVEASVHGR